MLLFGEKNRPLRPAFAAISAVMSLTVCLSLPVYQAEAAEIQQISFDDNLVDAAESGNANAVTSLVKSGKFVDSKGKLDTTALMRSVFNGNHEITKFLLESGANPNLTDVGGASAIHIAARKGNVEAIGMLAANGANLNLQDKEGWTPLMRAALYKQVDALAKLLQANAKPNLQNMMKETALLHASFTGDAKAVQMLIDHGADIRLRDENGLTAADIAFQRGFSDVQQILATASTAPTATVEKTTSTPQPLIEKKPEKQPEFSNIEPAREIKNTAMAEPANNSKSIAKSEAAATLDDYTETGQPRPREGFKPLPEIEDAEHEPGQTPQAASATSGGYESNDDSPSAPVGKHYLLQLGTFGTNRDAKERWTALQSSNTDLLGALHPVVSEVVLRTDQRTVYRTQAGYFSDQKSADAVCEKLFARNIDCFVVESAGEVTQQQEPPAPLAKVAEPTKPEMNEDVLAVKAAPAHQATAKEPEKIIPQPENRNVPWEVVKPQSIKEEMPDAPKSVAVKQSPKQPADLAELPERSTFSSDVPVLETLPPAQTAPENLQQMSSAIDEYSLPSNPQPVSSWLQISDFSSADAAQNFWQQLVAEVADTRDLRFRTIQPVQFRGGRYTSIRVGPIKSAETSRAICEFAKDNGQICRNIEEFTGEAGRPASNNSARFASPQAPQMSNSANGYWVMLGSFHQQYDAEKKWGELMKRNSDILRSFTPSVSEPRYSSSGQNVLRLRVGPFAQHQDAANMCADLQTRGVRCLTVRD